MILNQIDLSYSDHFTVFRGQIEDWNIKACIARDAKMSEIEILKKEKSLFEESVKNFDIQDHPYKDSYHYAQTWFDLFQLQHLGIKTRLVDWTRTKEHALFFAIDDCKKKSTNKNGVIWIYKCPRTQFMNFDSKSELGSLNKNPFELNDWYLIKHSSLFDDGYWVALGAIRKFRQDGCFIIPPSDQLQTSMQGVTSIEPYLEKIIIHPQLKKEIKLYLPDDLRGYLYAAHHPTCISIQEKVNKLNNKYFNTL